MFLCAYQLTACEELAKDFTQEAFVKLWENRDKINPTVAKALSVYHPKKRHIQSYPEREEVVGKKERDR